MKDNDIVRELAVKYKLDRRVISEVVRSPFLFVKDRMEMLEDTRSIRLPYFGLFMFNLVKTQQDKQLMLIHTAIKRIKKEEDNSSDSNYKEGLQKAVEIIRELIIERKGNPKEYGIEGESQEI